MINKFKIKKNKKKDFIIPDTTIFSARKIKYGLKKTCFKLKGNFKFWNRKQLIRKKKLSWWEQKKKLNIPKKYKALKLLSIINKQEKKKKRNIKKHFKYTLIIKQAVKLFYGNYKEKNIERFCHDLIKKKKKITLLINYFESRLDCTLVRLQFSTTFKKAQEWIKKGGVLINDKIITNLNYRVKINDKISLNTLVINEAFFLIQKKYDNLCWRYKIAIRKRKKGYIRKYWKYKKIKFTKLAWARSFFYFFNFTKIFVVNYNIFSAIKIKDNKSSTDLKFNSFLKSFKKSDKLFKIILTHYLNKK